MTNAITCDETAPRKPSLARRSFGAFSVHVGNLTPEQGLHALYPPGRHLLAKVRSFVDFLVARFGGEPVWDRA